MRKLKWILLLIAALALGGFLAYRFVISPRSNASTGLKTVKVRRGDVEVVVTASGNVRAAAQVNLGFRLGGQVAEVLVEEGQFVRAGQPLVRLDTRNLELQVAQAEASLAAAKAQLAKLLEGPSEAELEAARAAVRSAQAAYEAARAQVSAQNKDLRLAEISLEKAKAALEQARSAYDRVASRPDVAMLPQSLQLQQATLDYEAAKLRYEKTLAGINDTALQSAAAQLAQAKAQLDKLENTPSEEDVEVARAQVRQAEIALEQARLNLENATLKAPFDGLVTSVNVEVGQFVGAGTPVVTLVDLSSLEIRADVVEVDVSRLEEGQPVKIVFDAMPDRTYRGRIKRIGYVGQAIQGVVLFPVTVSIENPDEDVRVGMTANLEVIVGQARDVPVVPNSAIRYREGKQVVLVKRGEEVVPVRVEVGLAGETVSEIRGGDLREGDEVVVELPPSPKERRRIFRSIGRPPHPW